MAQFLQILSSRSSIYCRFLVLKFICCIQCWEHCKQWSQSAQKLCNDTIYNHKHLFLHYVLSKVLYIRDCQTYIGQIIGLHQAKKKTKVIDEITQINLGPSSVLLKAGRIMVNHHLQEGNVIVIWDQSTTIGLWSHGKKVMWCDESHKSGYPTLLQWWMHQVRTEVDEVLTLQICGVVLWSVVASASQV